MFIVRPKPSLRGALIKVAYRWLLVSMLGAHHPKGGHFSKTLRFSVEKASRGRADMPAVLLFERFAYLLSRSRRHHKRPRIVIRTGA
jgi:hypothetical protein